MAQKKNPSVDVTEAVADANAEAVVAETVTEVAYDKAQLLGSAKYAARRDLIYALLEDGRKYTFSMVDRMISDFLGSDFSENKERKGD